MGTGNRKTAAGKKEVKDETRPWGTRETLDHTGRTEVRTMTTSTSTRTAATVLERYTVTADVLLSPDVEADTPEAPLEHYRELRRTRPELRGRGDHRRGAGGAEGR
jgi:hypothetical protein